MTADQWMIVALLLAMLLLYASERFRIETVAMGGLAAGFALGLVPVQAVFAGFSSPAVITVAEILLIVGVLANSRTIDNFARRLSIGTNSRFAVSAIICITGAVISIFMNNIGALALMFPVALSVSARLGMPASHILMPLSFATLLGGTCSLTGTPANLIANQWMISETGGGFGYFDLMIVGGPVAVAGLAWILLAAPRIFGKTEGADRLALRDGPGQFLAEFDIPSGSALIGKSLPNAEADAAAQIHAVMRNGTHVFARRGDIVLAAGDRLIVEVAPERFDEWEQAGMLTAPLARSMRAGQRKQEMVVMPDSMLLGSRLGFIENFHDRGVVVLALHSRRPRVEGYFDDLQIGLGDVLLLAGDRAALREAAGDCGLLPLTPQRPPRQHRTPLVGLGLFVVGILFTAFGVAPPEIAFGGVVLAMLVSGHLNLKAGLQDVNWTIIVLLACMIPLGMAVESTGTARVLANVIVDWLPSTDPAILFATVILLAVMTTPFIDNVSTAVVLSPIAAGIASRTGLPLEPMLMAVAVGASLDFMTPFGHHNNAIVMGAGGYRFRDFPRLGAPLTVICVTVAVVALLVAFSA